MLYCTLLLIQLLCKIIYDHRIYVLFLVIFILNPYLANRVNSVITCFSTHDMDVLYLLHSVPVLSPGRSYVDVIRDMVEYHVFFCVIWVSHWIGCIPFVSNDLFFIVRLGLISLIQYGPHQLGWPTLSSVSLEGYLKLDCVLAKQLVNLNKNNK